MIFGIEENTNSIETISESMTGTQEELLSILSEGLKNIFQIKAEILKETVKIESRYINDELTLMESSIILESSFSDKIEYAKVVINNLKEKFIAWISKMITNIKLFLSNYEGFVKKNKQAIEELKNSGKKVSIRVYDITQASKFVDDLIVKSRNHISEICKLSNSAFKGNRKSVEELMEYIEENDILLVESNELIPEINSIMKMDQQPEEMEIPVDIILNQLEVTKFMIKRYEKYKKDFEKASTDAIKALSTDVVNNTATVINTEGGMECYTYAISSVSVLLTHIPKIIFYLCETNKKVTLEYFKILKDALR